MKMTGEQRIAAPRTAVWAALNDPDVLRQCIPGCQSLTRESETRMQAIAAIKIGPIGAKFTGAVTLEDLDPPNGYRIVGEGQGGVAGFAKGGAVVRLRDDGADTLLAYDVDAEVGGRLAQLGGPIIDATAKQLAGKFFRKFGELVTAPAAAAAAASAAEPAPIEAGIAARAVPDVTHAAPAIAPVVAAPALPAAWLLGIVVAALIGFLIGRGQGGTTQDWAGIAIGLLLLVVAAAAFEVGRRGAAPIVLLDRALLDRLAGRDGVGR